MRIGFLITARLKSTRLKRKILLDLNGKTVLDRVIERCKAVNGIDDVVLCTSVNPEDTELKENAEQNNINIFYGSEDDVLDRLLNAALKHKLVAFVSITADNPLFSVEVADKLVQWYRQDKPDFIFSSGLPVGCIPYFIRTDALKVAHHMKQESNTEIWGPFVNRPDFFKIGYLTIEGSPYKEEKRLTCDYPEDYILIKKLYDHFSKAPIPLTFDVIKFLNKNAHLWETNGIHKQTMLSEEIIRKIHKVFDNHIIGGYEFARKNRSKIESGILNNSLDFL